MAVSDKCITLSETQSSRLRAIAAARQTSEEVLLEDAISRLILDKAHVSAGAIEAWVGERRFIQALIAQGPAPGARSWTREDLHER